MHGWVNLNKPEGMSSAKAVSLVKRALKLKKIGHTGTLDPLACGVLPLAVGEATKLAQYVVADRKTYRFTVQWGQETTTDDREGEVTVTSDKRPTQDEIEAILPQFTGTIMQQPPAFSAIKIDGERAYKMARAGEVVEIPARPVEVYALRCEGAEDKGIRLNETTFLVECGKGTYVRSLARDMGRVLGCYGTVVFLQRCAVGFFTLDNAVSLDFCPESGYSLPPDFRPMPMGTPLDDIPAVHFGQDQQHRLVQGQAAAALDARRELYEAPLLRCLEAGGQKRFFALGKPVGGLIQPVRVFNL